MIYHQLGKRRTNKKYKLFLGTIALILAVIVLLSWLAPHALSTVVQTISRPFLASRTSSTASVDSIFTIFSSKQNLEKENIELKNQLALYNAVKTERDLYKTENTQLRTLLGNVPQDHKMVLGQIISKSGFSPYDTLIINAGSEDGLAENQLVFAEGNSLIGYISHVTSSSATVVLYSTSEQKTDVLVGTQALQTSAEGQGGGNFKIRLPKNSGIVIGDTISLAADSTKILGTVGQIMSSETDSFENILFRNTVETNHLNFVMVQVH